MNDWVEMFRGLGQAFLDLVKAELAELGEELKGSSKHLAIAAGLFVGALFITFWWVSVTLFLVYRLCFWLYRTWLEAPAAGAAAAGTVWLVFALVVGAVAFVGMRQLKKVENPAVLVERRWTDHMRWWHTRVLAEEKTVGGRNGAPMPAADATASGRTEADRRDPAGSGGEVR